MTSRCQRGYLLIGLSKGNASSTMGGKRKRTRSRPSAIGDNSRKRAKLGVREIGGREDAPNTAVQHLLLSLYYPKVITLRTFLQSKLPVSSKTRRQRLATAGYHDVLPNDGNIIPENGSDNALAALLDTSLVGIPNESEGDHESRMEELASFSQQHEDSMHDSSMGCGICSQSEVCDFTTASLTFPIH
ncbi:MAG: hypothetical protein M1827_003103 [Pycnora praestabilis]|nr:MAG: hypothetical protein M1827_003103 [Pycnora praestabilis]